MDAFLARVDAIDWSSREHAFGAADDVPAMFRLFLQNEYSKDSRDIILELALCHNGVISNIAFDLVPILVDVAKSELPGRVRAIGLLGDVLHGRGTLAAAQRFAERSAKKPAANPFKPAETIPPFPDPTALAKESVRVATLQKLIEDLDRWLASSGSEDEEEWVYAAYLLAAFQQHPRAEEARGRARELLSAIPDRYDSLRRPMAFRLGG